MPGMDKTGPFGSGPIGRGLGPCGGGQAGWGRGRGLRRSGWPDWGIAPAPLSPDEEKKVLERRKGWLETQLAAINQRLQGLEKDKDTE